MLTESSARQELIRTAAYAAERLDFIQSVGGNVSAKYDGGMFIKASGHTLRDTARGDGIATAGFLHRRSTAPDTLTAWQKTLTGKPRPSIEVSMHALLGPVVLHTHPVVANAFLCAVQSRDLIAEIVAPSRAYFYVPYAMPGLELGVEILNALSTHDEAPAIGLLENHGVVIHGPDSGSVIDAHELLLSVLQSRLKMKPPSFEPLSAEETVGAPAVKALRQALPQRPSYLALPIPPDAELEGLLFPDSAVFCGAEPLTFTTKSLSHSIDEYRTRWNQIPRTLRVDTTLICTGASETEARGVAEVCWAEFSIRRLTRTVGTPRPLPPERVRQLLTSDAEKYRQDLVSGKGHRV